MAENLVTERLTRTVRGLTRTRTNLLGDCIAAGMPALIPVVSPTLSQMAMKVLEGKGQGYEEDLNIQTG